MTTKTKLLLILILLKGGFNLPAAPTPAPDLRIHKAGEFGTNVHQTIKLPLNTFYITEQAYNISLAQVGLHYPAFTNQNHRLMQFDFGLVNTGNDHWSAGNAFANPERFVMLPGYRQPHIRGLYGVVISHTNGNVMREYLGVTSLVWDAYASLPNLEKGPFNWFMPGTSAGHASQGGTFLFDGTYVDVTGLTNGIYNFRMIVDPLNMYGQRAPHKDFGVRFHLNNFDSKVVVP